MPAESPSPARVHGLKVLPGGATRRAPDPATAEIRALALRLITDCAALKADLRRVSRLVSEAKGS
jgi:hypothetical protein